MFLKKSQNQKKSYNNEKIQQKKSIKSKRISKKKMKKLSKSPKIWKNLEQFKKSLFSRTKNAIILGFQYQEDTSLPKLSSPTRFRNQGGSPACHKGQTEIVVFDTGFKSLSRQNRKSQGAETFERIFTPILCHMSCAHVTCHASHSHVSCVNYYFFYQFLNFDCGGPVLNGNYLVQLLY